MYSPILDTLEREAAAASTTEKSGGRSERTRQSEKEKFCIVKYYLITGQKPWSCSYARRLASRRCEFESQRQIRYMGNFSHLFVVKLE